MQRHAWKLAQGFLDTSNLLSVIHHFASQNPSTNLLAQEGTHHQATQQRHIMTGIGEKIKEKLHLGHDSGHEKTSTAAHETMKTTTAPGLCISLLQTAQHLIYAERERPLCRPNIRSRVQFPAAHC
jgi:hypothetical protein